MAMLLRCEQLRKTFGTHTLFQGVSLAIETGDRIGLIGPNGSGKSTLLKILAGLETGDDAATGAADQINTRKHLRTGYVAQADTFDDSATLLDVVTEALADRFPEPHEREQEAALALAKVDLTDPLVTVGTLSGGWRKRLAVARELVRAPDLLLMDEPTNHLDVAGIEWLEQLLTSQSFATVVVTHDRSFLEQAVNRIVELSRSYPGGTFSVDGPYSTFLERRDAFLESQQKQQQRLASKVREDIQWLKQGVKARETRSKSRLDASKQRSEQLSALQSRNAPTRTADLDFTASGRKSQKLLVASGVGKSIDGKPLFRDVDMTLSPGMCLGVLGGNGSGKTTLLRLLAGELEPDEGRIKRAEALRTVVFTQGREQLELTDPLREALSPGGDFVTFRGQQLHVRAWARRFLFRPDQLDVSVGDLSGGEQARILIARLMLEPADVLILDEPTNDLDIASLEVLEQSLRDFPGAVVLVTHDRFMLDRLCTQILALDGHGTASFHADRLQWQRAQQAEAQQDRTASLGTRRETQPRTKDASASTSTARPAKLSYKEKLELDQMEQKILDAEAEVARLEALVADPAVAADHVRLQRHCRELETAQAEVTRLYERWAALSDRPR